MMNEHAVVDLLKIADRIGVDVWIDGGWGVDALVGRQTRPHNDIDIFIEKKNADAFTELIFSKGYREVEMEYTTADHMVWQDSCGHVIDLHLFEFETERTLYYDNESYPSNILSGEGKIGGFPVRCLTAEAQLQYHQGYEYSEKDIRDVLLLCKTFRLPLPDKYRDDYVKKVAVGEPETHNGEIVLDEYNPSWPVLFETETKRISKALGDRALQIHHVGSTSVPGLCAKPIIDIILVVADSSNEPDYVPALESAGYIMRIREPDWFEHRLLKGSDPAVNLHVFSENTTEIERMLVFREWLRNHKGDRKKYEQAKRELARQTWSHVQHYADAKTEIIEEFMKRALLEEIKSLIRTETPADYAAVYELIKAAFAEMEHADGNEQDLVERMRKSAAFVPELSLVAEVDGKLIGHIMFTKISIGDHIGLCLAPVSVLPEYQKRGVGSALIKRGHKIAAQLGYELCLIVGHAEYYPRFGYERASKYAITQPFPAPDECVMVKFLTDAGRKITGAAVFPPEFY